MPESNLDIILKVLREHSLGTWSQDPITVTRCKGCGRSFRHLIDDNGYGTYMDHILDIVEERINK